MVALPSQALKMSNILAQLDVFLGYISATTAATKMELEAIFVLAFMLEIGRNIWMMIFYDIFFHRLFFGRYFYDDV